MSVMNHFFSCSSDVASFLTIKKILICLYIVIGM